MVKQGYKQTEIGVIPEDWEVKKINDISNPVRGGSPRPAGSPLFFNGNYIPWLTVASLTNISNSKIYVDNTESMLTELGSNYSRRLEKDTLIISNSGATLGVAKLLGIECCANDGIAALLDLKADNKFLVYYINSLTEYLRNNVATGNGQPNLNTDLIGNLSIPLPPLAEQEAIATALSDADAWIENLEQFIAKKRLIKQGAMQELLTPPSTSSGNADGEALEPWEVKKLGEVCEIIMGQSPLSENYNQNGIGLPLIQGNADIDNRETIIRNYTSQITKRGEIGDIIMSVRAPVGEIAKATFKCCLGRGVCAIRSENDYLYHYLIYSENNWGQFSTGSTFDSVNSNQVNDFSINQPKSLSEQTRIATILSDMDAELEALEQKLSKARQIKQGMMQELLTGRIRL